MTNGLLICIWGNICAFPHIFRSSSSYMTFQLLHSEFPHMWGKFDSLFYQCRDNSFGEQVSKIPDFSNEFARFLLHLQADSWKREDFQIQKAFSTLPYSSNLCISYSGSEPKNLHMANLQLTKKDFRAYLVKIVYTVVIWGNRIPRNWAYLACF